MRVSIPRYQKVNGYYNRPAAIKFNVTHTHPNEIVSCKVTVKTLIYDEVVAVENFKIQRSGSDNVILVHGIGERPKGCGVIRVEVLLQSTMNKEVKGITDIRCIVGKAAMFPNPKVEKCYLHEVHLQPGHFTYFAKLMREYSRWVCIPDINAKNKIGNVSSVKELSALTSVRYVNPKQYVYVYDNRNPYALFQINSEVLESVDCEMELWSSYHKLCLGTWKGVIPTNKPVVLEINKLSSRLREYNKCKMELTFSDGRLLLAEIKDTIWYNKRVLREEGLVVPESYEHCLIELD